MKKILAMLVLALMMVGVASADTVITPQSAGLGQNDVAVVDVCVTRSDDSPYVGLDLVVDKQCQDLNGDETCSDAEDGNAVGVFSATVIASPTNASGCGQVQLETTNADGGRFAYSVNSYNGQVLVSSENGVGQVPEFGIIGASLVLIAAGLFIARRREE